MKNKRILSILMVLMLIFNLSTFAAAETTESASAAEEFQVNEESAQKAYDILTGIGIFSTVPEINTENVSRGNFAALVASLAGVKDVIGADTGYRDVTASNSNFSAISHAVSNGWMTGDKGLFKPDDPIILSDALKALVGMLSHSAAMKESQYLGRARSLGLLSGIKAGLNSPLSGGAVCKLLLNALEADYMEEDGVEAGTAIYKNAGPLLTAVHNIRIVKGTVTATKRTGLYDAQDVNGIKIGENFYFSEKDFSNFLGMNVECYVDFSPSKDKEALLVIEANNNEIVNLVAEDIETLVNKETLHYYPTKDSKKTSEMKLSAVTPVIYNGIYSGTVSNFSTLELILRDMADRPECATLRLVDNNDDKKADAVIVWYYETYVISTADAENMYYRDATAKKSFCLIDYEDAEICVTTNGNPGKLADLRENSVVSVAISANKKVVDIYVNSKVLQDAIVEGADGDSFEINGEWYETSSYYEDIFSVALGEREKTGTVKLGAVGTVYLDFLNRIVKGSFTTELKYAYMTAAAKRGTMGNKYEMKLFVFDNETKESEFKVYPLKERFKLDGKSVKRKDITETILYDGSGNAVPQLIKYKINTNGEIEEIRTADTSKKLSSLIFGPNDNYYTEGELELKYKGQARWNGDAGLFGNKFRVSTSSIVLNIPNDVTKEEFFSISSPDSLFGNGSTYEVEIYNVNKNGFANVVIYRSNTTVSTSFSYKRTLFVSDVKYARTEEGDYVQQITGYGFNAENWLKINTTAKVYKVTDDFTFTVSYKAEQHGITISDNNLKPGDVIRFNVNTKGEMTNARLEFRYSPDAPMMNYMAAGSNGATTPNEENQYVSGETFGYSGAEGGSAYGKVAVYESGSTAFGLTYDDGDTMHMFKNEYTAHPYFVFDTEEKTTTVSTSPDIRTCLYDGAENADTAFVLAIYCRAYFTVIYK